MTTHEKIFRRVRQKSSFAEGRKYDPVDLLAQSGQWFMRKAIEASSRGARLEARRYFKLANDAVLRSKR